MLFVPVIVLGEKNVICLRHLLLTLRSIEEGRSSEPLDTCWEFFDKINTLGLHCWRCALIPLHLLYVAQAWDIWEIMRIYLHSSTKTFYFAIKKNPEAITITWNYLIEVKSEKDVNHRVYSQVDGAGQNVEGVTRDVWEEGAQKVIFHVHALRRQGNHNYGTSHTKNTWVIPKHCRTLKLNVKKRNCKRLLCLVVWKVVTPHCALWIYLQSATSLQWPHRAVQMS